MESKKVIIGCCLHLILQTKMAYYGDSLNWNIPTNLTDMVGPLLLKLGIQLELYNITPMQSIGNKEIKKVNLFYPNQTCSNVCGVIVICVAAVMCCNWNTWDSWKEKTPPLCLASPLHIVLS